MEWVAIRWAMPGWNCPIRIKIRANLISANSKVVCTNLDVNRMVPTGL